MVVVVVITGRFEFLASLFTLVIICLLALPGELNESLNACEMEEAAEAVPAIVLVITMGLAIFALVFTDLSELS